MTTGTVKRELHLFFPLWFGYAFFFFFKKNPISFTNFCSLISLEIQGNYRGEFMNPIA